MGFFDSLFGIDMDFDGKTDAMDDMLFMAMVDGEEKRRAKEEQDWLDLDEAEDMEEDW